jgi:hypothetical protein
LRMGLLVVPPAAGVTVKVTGTPTNGLEG